MFAAVVLAVTFLTPSSFHADSVTKYDPVLAGSSARPNLIETQIVSHGAVQTGSSGDPVLNGYPASRIVVGGRSYLFIYGRWFGASRSALQTNHVYTFGSFYPSPSMLGSHPTELPQEIVGGVLCDVWRSSGGVAEWTVWIGVHDHLLHRSEERYRAMDDGVTYNVDQRATYSAFNQPVVISAPPAFTSADDCSLTGTPQVTDTVPAPTYPAALKKLGLGSLEVLVRAGVLADGSVANWKVEKSSGNADVDNAALAAAKNATFALVPNLCAGAWALGILRFDFNPQ